MMAESPMYLEVSDPSEFRPVSTEPSWHRLSDGHGQDLQFVNEDQRWAAELVIQGLHPEWRWRWVNA